MLTQPGQRRVRHRRRRSSYVRWLVVRVETGIQPGRSLQRSGAHERRGGVPIGPCQLREGLDVRLAAKCHSAVQHVGVNPVFQRVQPREQRRVRRKRHRHRGDRLLKEDRLLHKGVDIGRGVAKVPIAAQMIRPQRIDHNQDDVGRRRLVGRRPPRVASAHARQNARQHHTRRDTRFGVQSSGSAFPLKHNVLRWRGGQPIVYLIGRRLSARTSQPAETPNASTRLRSPPTGIPADSNGGMPTSAWSAGPATAFRNSDGGSPRL